MPGIERYSREETRQNFSASKGLHLEGRTGINKLNINNITW
jgi:hypothetical protein